MSIEDTKKPNEDNKDSPVCEVTENQVDKYKDVERFKLGIWIAKLFSIFAVTMLSSFIISYAYVSIKTQQLADLGAAGSLLGGFFEIIKVIIVP